MNRTLAMLIIGLVFGGGIGFVLAAANGVTLDGHNHATDHVMPKGMDHSAQTHGAPISLEKTDTSPVLTLEALEDPVSGWNLNIQTKHFQFSPANSGLSHVEGQGHAHVYIDGVKWGRVYGSWVHLDIAPDGPVEVKVTLNSNDHRPLHVEDQPLAASVKLQASGS